MIYTRLYINFHIMTSQILFRVPTELKMKFKQTVKDQGVSMDYVLNLFIRAYVENPKIIKVEIDENELRTTLESMR